MMTYDQKWGGRPGRAHDYGHIPWNEASKVPSLSHYLHDTAPFFPCCMWNHDQSWWCMTFRFERRVSQNCVGYQPPGIGKFLFGVNKCCKNNINLKYHYYSNCVW